MTTLSLCNLSLGYALEANNTKVLGHQWNATLETNALTTLVGKNGTGKSTLLKTIAGIVKPLYGDVLINNTSLFKMPPTERTKWVSVVLSAEPIEHNMSVYECVSLGRYPHTNYFGTLKQTDKKAINHALEQMKVSHLTHKLLAFLSDGERQRVMIARALAQDTPIILMDEPTAHLDYLSKKQLMEQLATFAKAEKKTLLVSSHDLHVAFQSTHSVWFITPRQQLECGSVNHLTQNKLLNSLLYETI